MVADADGTADRDGHGHENRGVAKPRIVGIGASAGGIRALQEFFHALQSPRSKGLCRSRPITSTWFLPIGASR